MKCTLILLSAGLCLLASGKPAAPRKITSTETGKSGPSAQTIQGGNVTLSLSVEGKPLSYMIGNGSNLLLHNNGGPGFHLTTGSGAQEKTIPFVSAESKDGKLILTAGDQTRVTLAANAGDRFISFNLENIENAPEGTQPILNFRVQFQPGVFPETVPFDHMCLAGGGHETKRSMTKVSWPYFWQRAENDPPGGFAFFVPQNDEEHNEVLLRIWTEENVPHPNVGGEWTYERAKQWAEEWKQNAQDMTYLVISAEKPEDLDPLIGFAKKLKVKNVFMHTDTWRGQYWPRGRDALSVNPNVFPRGEKDLKDFADKLKANGIGMMMHTLCYGIPSEGSKYLGKGKKPDRRLAFWGKGKLEQPISPTDTTILFRPDPGAKLSNHPRGWLSDVMIGDEIINCTFTDMDKGVWMLKDCKRGAEPASHGAGTEVIGLIKAYGQNYYPSSMTDLPEITGGDYAEFFNRLGVQHHEYDGKESHDDFPWGFPKWSMFVYQNTKLPMTSNTSSGGTNPWDLMYRFKRGVPNKGSAFGCGSGATALMLERNSRLATSPIENHFSMGIGAAANTPGFVFEKPEPMFGVFPSFIQEHGLVDLIAEQFNVWREITPRLTLGLRKQIAGIYQRNPNSHHHNAKIVHEARRAGGGYELQPFTIMTRGPVDADWTTLQESGSLMPRQYVAPGMRISLDNLFGRQAPQFIIRVMNGYTDGVAAVQPSAPAEVMSEDMKGYLAAAGQKVDDSVPPVTPSTPNAASYRLQRLAAQMLNPGRHVFADVGPALEVSLDNTAKQEATTKSPKPGSVDYEQHGNFPAGRGGLRGNSLNASGLALTVTGDGSGALLVIEVGAAKDYMIPIDFTGRKEVFIPCAEVARAAGGWGVGRAHASKRSTYGEVRSVSIGFGRVPANTHAKVLIEDLRMVGEKPSSIKNPVIHAGVGTLAIQGEVKSSQYLWYQGGDKVGIYDKNWNHQADLPVVATNYEVDKGFSEYWIEGETSDPAPWFDVQFITKGDVIAVPAMTTD